MKRIALLLCVISLILIGVLAVTVLLPGSGSSFAKRLQAYWRIGSLQLDYTEAEAEGLYAINLPALAIASPTAIVAWPDWDPVLNLEEVTWQRPEILPQPFGLRWEGAELSFARGTLQIARRRHDRWTSESLLAQSGNSWSQLLPSRIRGDQLRFRATLDPGVVEFEVQCDYPNLQRSGENLSFSCELQGASWQEGSAQAKWNKQAGGGVSRSFSAQFDSVDLHSFPFTELHELFEMPWLAMLADGVGNVDLDWRIDDNTTDPDSGLRQRLKVEFLEVELPLPPHRHPLRFMTGHAELSAEQHSLTIDRAYFSQSTVTGSLEYWPESRRLEGRWELAGMLQDKALVQIYLGRWAGLIRDLGLSGDGLLEVEVDGSTEDTLEQQLSRLSFSFEQLSVLGKVDEFAISGQLEWQRSTDDFQSIELQATQVRAFGIDWGAQTWVGELWPGELRFRQAQAGLAEEVELIIRRDAEVTHFELIAPRLNLSKISGQNWGDLAVLNIQSLKGSWQSAKGLSWQGSLLFNSVDASKSNWPIRKPQGFLRGELKLNFQDGIISIENAQFFDSSSRWDFFGAVKSDGQMQLSGLLIDDPLGFDQQRRTQAGSLERSRSFELQGLLDAWQLKQ